MTSQPPAGDPRGPTVEPQPLKFEPTAGPSTEAIFEAPVPGHGEPGAPAVTLAVTVDSSVLSDSGDELEGLLGGMRAAVEVLPELPPDWDVSGDGEEPSGEGDGEEPLDLKKDLRIGLGLVWPEGAVPVAVIVTVETTTGIVPAPRIPEIPQPEIPQPEILRRLGVTQRLDDYWYATNSPPPTARVHVTGGQGTMRRPGGRYPTNLHMPPPDNFPLSKATAFILHAVGGAMGYTLNSGFYSPQHPNNR